MSPDRASGYRLQHVKEYRIHLRAKGTFRHRFYELTVARESEDVGFATIGVKRRFDRLDKVFETGF